jgi:hypothetical protein
VDRHPGAVRRLAGTEERRTLLPAEWNTKPPKIPAAGRGQQNLAASLRCGWQFIGQAHKPIITHTPRAYRFFVVTSLPFSVHPFE